MSLLYPQCSIGGGKGEGQFEKEMAMNNEGRFVESADITHIMHDNWGFSKINHGSGQSIRRYMTHGTLSPMAGCEAPKCWRPLNSP